MAELAPVGEPLQVGAGLAEELQLHLLELADAEDEVARGDLVAEGLAHLAHAEGNLPAGGALDVLEVDEDALGCLGAQIDRCSGILVDALEGLEHQVELADVGEIALAAAGAGHLMLADEAHQLVVVHGLDVDVQSVLVDEALHQLVGAMAHFAGLAVNQRIVEGAHVAGGHPHLRVHQDGGVQPHVIGGFLDEFLPPGALDVVLQLHTQRAVVPAVGQTAVNVGTREDKAPVLAECNDLVHGFFGRQHCDSFFPARLAAGQSIWHDSAHYTPCPRQVQGICRNPAIFVRNPAVPGCLRPPSPRRHLFVYPYFCGPGHGFFLRNMVYSWRRLPHCGGRKSASGGTTG